MRRRAYGSDKITEQCDHKMRTEKSHLEFNEGVTTLA